LTHFVDSNILDRKQWLVAGSD